MVRIALIQQRAGPDKGANLERGLRALERAADDGARLVCYAELAFEPFYPQHEADRPDVSLAEPIPGPVTDAFARRASELDTVVVLNLFERDGDRTFDASPVIDTDGSLLGVTRMVHITDYACFHEQDWYTPGDLGAPVYDTGIGRLGVAICYDRHYPEYMRGLALGGAEVVVVPQAGAVGEWTPGLFEAEMAVAAFQNGYFVALCNRVGEEERLTFRGESFVCGPDGAVLAQAPEAEDHILYADLDFDDIDRSYARRLFLQHRRPELYADWVAPEAR